MRFRSLFIPVSLALIFSPTVMAGNPDSPAPPDSTFSLNLEDLYLRLMTGANGTSMTFTEPATAPGTGTMHTIDEIMAASPAADDTNGALPTEVHQGKTYWGLRTDGTWGHQTGNLNPCTTDSDGDTIPNCYDQCLADPAKVFPGTCGCGFADVGDQDGDGLLDCEDPCPLPGQDLWVGDLCLSNGTCTEVYFADDPDGDGCTNSKSMSPTTGCDCDTPACF